MTRGSALDGLRELLHLPVTPDEAGEAAAGGGCSRDRAGTLPVSS